MRGDIKFEATHLQAHSLILVCDASSLGRSNAQADSASEGRRTFAFCGRSEFIQFLDLGGFFSYN